MNLAPLLVLASLSAATPSPAPAQAAPVLSLEQATRAAMEAQPSLRQARAQTLAARERALQFRAPLLPQVNASASYLRSTSNFVAGTGGISREFQTGGGLNAGLTASQLIWDFETRDRYAASRASAEAQQAAEETSRQQVLLQVRTAFFDAQSSRALVAVAEETLENQRRHLAQIQGFVEVGTRPMLDLVQARADVANAQVQLVQSRNGYLTAKARLNQVMGRSGPADFEVGDEKLPAVDGEQAATQALFEQARAARPELDQLDQQLRSQQLNIRSLRGGYLPSLGVAAGTNTAGAGLTDQRWSANAQVTLSWQLFQGFQTRHQVGEAEANLAQFEAQRDGALQELWLQVEQARLNVEASKASLDASAQALENARERLKLAEGRYQAGVGNILELADAQLALTNAAAQSVQAEYALSVSRAQLLSALGRE